MRQMKHVFTALLLALTCSGFAAQADDGVGLLEAISDADPAPLIVEHVYGGMPIDEGTLYVRQGYVLAYEPERRVALAFLLPHQQVRHGEPEHFLVSVRLLEAMTDLTFFRDLIELHGEETIEDWKAEESWTRWPVFGE